MAKHSRATTYLEANPFNPFNFLIDPTITPSQDFFYYSDKYSDYLKPYLNNLDYPELSTYTKHVVKQSEDQIVPFLSLLVQKVYDDWEHEKRFDDQELDARLCFERKKGSCKDLAWMLMMMLRGVGLATRFVSGYAYNRSLTTVTSCMPG